MIDVKELRIGNRVNFEGKNYQVGAIFNAGRVNLVGYDDGSVCEKQLDPIPLTPELLEKCGFEKALFGSDNCYTMIYCRPHEKQPAQVIALLTMNLKPIEYSFVIQNDANDMRIALTSVRHLHQLMNLYYFLTNQELNIQL